MRSWTFCRLSCDPTEATIHCYSCRICTMPNPRPRVTVIRSGQTPPPPPGNPTCCLNNLLVTIVETSCLTQHGNPHQTILAKQGSPARLIAPEGILQPDGLEEAFGLGTHLLQEILHSFLVLLGRVHTDLGFSHGQAQPPYKMSTCLLKQCQTGKRLPSHQFTCNLTFGTRTL